MTGRGVVRVGVGCIVADALGRVALLRRKRDGAWTLPGGEVEFGECPRRAARREIEEELGIAAECEVELIGAVSVVESNAHWISLVYRLVSSSGQPRIAEPQIHDDLSWFSPSMCPTATKITRVTLHWLVTERKQ